MYENINKITNLNFVNSIFKNNILDQLVFSKSINKVFIFTVSLTNCINNASKYWDYLSVEEKIKANKYYTNSLRDKYITYHGILRHILSYYNKQYPQDIEFTHNEYGKPF